MPCIYPTTTAKFRPQMLHLQLYFSVHPPFVFEWANRKFLFNQKWKDINVAITASRLHGGRSLTRPDLSDPSIWDSIFEIYLICW